MIKTLKRFYVEHYQRWRWYESFTVNEYSKFVNIVSPTLIFAFLTWMKINGYIINWWKLIIGYLIISGVAIIVGKWLVKLGVASYNNRIANEQNRELMEILDTVKRIEEKQK